MNIIVCVDKNYGMMFNGRRQSQDSILREKVMELSTGAKLWMNAYSARQFEDTLGIQISETFLEEAGMGEFCFIEDGKLPEQNIEKIYLFHWNRKYPADVFFEFDLKGKGLYTNTDYKYLPIIRPKIKLGGVKCQLKYVE